MTAINNWVCAWQNQQNDLCAHPVNTQISLGICPDWEESSLSAWRTLVSLATHGEHTANTLIRLDGCLSWSVFAGRTGQFVGFIMQLLNFQTFLGRDSVIIPSNSPIVPVGCENNVNALEIVVWQNAEITNFFSVTSIDWLLHHQMRIRVKNAEDYLSLFPIMTNNKTRMLIIRQKKLLSFPFHDKISGLIG